MINGSMFSTEILYMENINLLYVYDNNNYLGVFIN